MGLHRKRLFDRSAKIWRALARRIRVGQGATVDAKYWRLNEAYQRYLCLI